MGRHWADKDFYRVLDVEPTSTPEAITKSYRTCMKIVHPDLNTQDPEIQATANKLAQAYSEAYEVLSNPARRSEYDRWRSQAGQRTQNQPPPAEERDPGYAERQAQEQEQARAQEQEQARAQERERAEEEERAAAQAREQAQARASEDKARRAAEEQARARERERAQDQARREAQARERERTEERARARTAEQPASRGAGRTRQEAEARAWAFAMLQSDPIIREDGLITYAAVTGVYFTVSGFSADGEIFYMREWVGPGSSNTLTWTYPAEQKEQYDDVVNHVVESFTPGDLESAH